MVEPPDLTVPADPDRLHQVVANLLHNAVRHSPADDEVRLEARAGGRRTCASTSSTTGRGSPASSGRTCSSGSCAGNSPAVTGQVSTGGTGLGLAIVRWAVELHGGRIEVADTERRLHDARDPARRSAGRAA